MLEVTFRDIVIAVIDETANRIYARLRLGCYRQNEWSSKWGAVRLIWHLGDGVRMGNHCKLTLKDAVGKSVSTSDPM